VVENREDATRFEMLVRLSIDNIDKSWKGVVSRVDALETRHDAEFKRIDGLLNTHMAAHDLSQSDVLENLKGVTQRIDHEVLLLNNNLDGLAKTWANTEKRLGTALEDHDVAFVKLTTAQTGMLETVKSHAATVGEVRAEMTLHREHTATQIKDARGYTDLQVRSLDERLSSHLAGLSIDVKAMREEVGDNATAIQGVAAGSNEVAQRVKDVGNRLEISSKEFDALRQACAADFARVEANAASHREAVMQTVSNLIVSIDDARTEFKTILGAEEAKRKGTDDELMAHVTDLANNFLKVETRMVGELDALRAAALAGDTATLDKAEQRAAMLVKNTAEDLVNELERLRSAVEALPDTPALAAVESRAAARLASLAETVEASQAALQKQLDTARDLIAFGNGKVDEVSAELRGLLEAKHGEFAEATFAPQLGPVDVQTSYEDGKLKVRVGLGEQYSESTIPVDIGVRYRGPYKDTMEPKPGDMVTHKGSVWFCKSPAPGAPGKDFTGWQLAVKCGADGRDGRALKCYDLHKEGTVYRNGDFLRANNRLWQCAVEETRSVPEPGDIRTTTQWVLVGGV
jgi:hypothetical protein